MNENYPSFTGTTVLAASIYAQLSTGVMSYLPPDLTLVDDRVEFPWTG